MYIGPKSPPTRSICCRSSDMLLRNLQRRDAKSARASTSVGRVFGWAEM